MGTTTCKCVKLKQTNKQTNSCCFYRYKTKGTSSGRVRRSATNTPNNQGLGSWDAPRSPEWSLPVRYSLYSFICLVHYGLFNKNLLLLLRRMVGREVNNKLNRYGQRQSWPNCRHCVGICLDIFRKLRKCSGRIDGARKIYGAATTRTEGKVLQLGPTC
jgi:hypothetical protein